MKTLEEKQELVRTSSDRSTMSSMYINYGCGHTAPPEWTNFDSSLTLKVEQIPIVGKVYKKNSSYFGSNVRVGDIVTGLPIPDASCQGVYASHVLEHLTLNDFHTALTNTRKMLKAGGLFRLVVPDLEWAAREYVKRLDQSDPAANEIFLDETRLGARSRGAGAGAKLYEVLTTSRHFWMWDQFSLARALKEHGFEKIRRCAFGDSEDPMFRLVEASERFENAVAMEARA